MSRMKQIFALMLMAAIACLVPQAQATATKAQTTIAGSSAMWQATALAAFALVCPSGYGSCPTTNGVTAGHWTSASNDALLTDSRPSTPNVDAGTIWIVWNAGATKVWSFNKVDSVVGDRCYFAQPQCVVTVTDTTSPGAQQIATSLWGSDSNLPSITGNDVQTFFATGTPVNVAATDIRPEDAAFAACRVNSALGAGTHGGTASDGLDGLGYNSANASGVCAPNGLGNTAANYVGSPIKSGYPSSTSQANVLSFNISGTDPISGKTIPAFKVVRVGAAPIVFVTERATALAGLTEATDKQLQQAFSGSNCNASAFGLASGAINVFLREPLSGTMNTTEATIFRKPTIYTGSNGGPVIGVSQETGVGLSNPLSNTCAAGGGSRYRAIGTGEEVKSVLNSSAKFAGNLDGIGYTFFSYGNVGSLSNSPTYGYIQINTGTGTYDPIFASYAGGDPGQPGNGTIPGAANLPNACGGAFPCSEGQIWTLGLSFPNVRSGKYPAWSILRLVSNGAGLTAAEALIAEAEKYTVTTTPDFVPISKTVAGGITDPGLLIERSHYQQYDGAGTFLGATPVDKGATEAGGDMGGCILPTSGSHSTLTQLVNGDYPAYLYPNCGATRP
ncbi:MAG: hypothetical protein WAM89_20510 [Terriglobales bacterium]